MRNERGKRPHTAKALTSAGIVLIPVLSEIRDHLAESLLLNKVVMPALGEAEHAFSAALARINVEDLAHSAEHLGRAARDG